MQVNSSHSTEPLPNRRTGWTRALGALRPSHAHTAFTATLVLMASTFLSRIIGLVRVKYILWLFGRGMTIASHGSDIEQERLEPAIRRHRGLRGLFGAEQIVKRQYLGGPGRPVPYPARTDRDACFHAGRHPGHGQSGAAV